MNKDRQDVCGMSWVKDEDCNIGTNRNVVEEHEDVTEFLDGKVHCV